MLITIKKLIEKLSQFDENSVVLLKDGVNPPIPANDVTSYEQYYIDGDLWNSVVIIENNY